MLYGQLYTGGFFFVLVVAFSKFVTQLAEFSVLGFFFFGGGLFDLAFA